MSRCWGASRIITTTLTMESFKLLIHSATQVVQVVSNKESVVSGHHMKSLAVLENGDGYSIVVNRDGVIHDIGTDIEIKNRFAGAKFDKTLDATGKCVIPGLVDGHTHSLWEGDRVHEFAMKLAGATYMEVHKAGGGINFTVDHVRKASENELYTNFKKRAQNMLKAGTTLAECKSGYGLDTETEMKMLKVFERAKQDPSVHMGISSTYCGPHAIPKGMTAAQATEDVIKNQLPRLKSLMDCGQLSVDNIDVFCEQGVYDVEQTRRILKAGQDLGLSMNFHGEELHRLNSAEMGAELGARAISHLEEVSDEGIKAMAKSGTIGVVLPTTAYILRLEPPPVRKMIESGMSVALGSDLNPNAHCFAMPIVMHLACVTMKMSMQEALIAATINAAASLGKSHSHGSIEVGKNADLLVLDVPRWEHLIYQLGSYHHIIDCVIKEGVIIHQ